MERLLRKIWIGGMIKKVLLLLVLVSLVGIGSCFYMSLEPVPLVIFAGGGSVKNFINSKYGVNLDSIESSGIPKSVYINVPSEYGWTLLKEEISRFRKESNPRDFLYICLSADSINIDSLRSMGLKDEDSIYARIYGYHIGDDSLKVYFVKSNHKERTIPIGALKKKISPFYKHSEQATTGKIYATSRRSGTLRRYQEILEVNFDTISNSLYYETVAINDNKEVMVLGSSCYKPKLDNYNKNDTISSLVVTNENPKRIVKKPLYIYFVVFAKDRFKPNKRIVDFFEKNLKIKDFEKKVNSQAYDSLLNHLN